MIRIDLKSRVPLYEQITESVKELTLAGIYKPDDQLPSVRQLTVQLGINPNTIQKAYTELEREGVIYSLTGRGNFITSNIDRLIEKNRMKLTEQLREIIKEMKRNNLPKEEALNCINEIYEDSGVGL